MGRNVDTTSPLDKVPTAVRNETNFVAVGKSLTTTVTAILIEGSGWVDYIAVRNASAVGGNATNATQHFVYVDGSLILTGQALLTPYFSPVYGNVGTSGEDPAHANPIVFDRTLEVRLKSSGAEASFSASLAICYGTVD